MGHGEKKTSFNADTGLSIGPNGRFEHKGEHHHSEGGHPA